MLYNSPEFLLLFMLTLLLLSSSHLRLRRVVLLTASLVFYASWSPKYLFLLGLIVVGNYALGKRAASRGRGVPGGVAILAALFNLGLLAFFKYADFALGNLSPLIEMMGFEASALNGSIVLPLAISFMTFQGLAYVIDVGRGEEPAGSLFEFALFICFFPQLIAGPIVRGSELLPQLRQAPRLGWDSVRSGVNMMLIGYAKKCLLADYLGVFVDQVWADGAAVGGLDNLLAAYAYTFQIYFDFSGYTDIGRGAARVMGYELPSNFNKPYHALGIQDFWRRWHLTLSRWLRDYLYISLGGSRKGALRTYVNLMLTMLLGGLWHGAAWGFVLWGALHGAALAVDRWAHQHAGVSAVLLQLNQSPIYRAALRVATFHFVLVGWILFRLVDATESFNAIHSILILEPGSSAGMSTAAVGLFLLMVCYFGLSPLRQRLVELSWPRLASPLAALAIGLMLGLAPPQASFIYFQF